MALSEINEDGMSASYMKVAYLYMAVQSHLGIECYEKILQKPGDINYKMPTCDNTGANLNLLHSAYGYSLFETFELLVNHGVDFTVKDNESRTVVHRVIYDRHNECQSAKKFEDAYVNLILSAHVKFQNISNPSCKYSISHFHAACMTNHVEAVEFFLANGVSVDEAVKENSPIFAGFTPLHFAVKYSCLEAVEILLKYGAKVHLKNVAKMTPLHLVVERKMNECKWKIDEFNKEMIKLLLKQDVNKNIVDDFGLTKLHVACVIEDASIVESILADQPLDVNRAVNIDSPTFSGYTPLHFAATSDINTVNLLLSRGADFEAKDKNNATPFDLCFQKQSVEDIHYIMLNQTKWKDIILSDGKTRLLDLVFSMKRNDDFIDFLTNVESIADLIVPIDSPLWPGYTILHLAVIFSENDNGDAYYFEGAKDTRKVEECLVRGANIIKVDTNNLTALHLAFYTRKVGTVSMLLKHHLTVENPFDGNNLSHFHIACVAKDESTVERFLSNGFIDVNIPITTTIKTRVFHSHLEVGHVFFTAGSTALHMNVACGNLKITKLLLEKGANIYAKDCNGSTPIHRLLTSNSNTTSFDEGIDDLLLNLDDLRDSIANGGLSHLHVACHLDKLDSVEKLLDSGADVNAVVTYETTTEILDEEDYYYDPYGDPSKDSLSFLARYSGFTPLSISLKRYNTDIQILLMRRGADILAGSRSKNVPRIDEEILLVALLGLNNKTSSNMLARQLGLPMLHIACYSRDLDLVEELLLKGKDVNMKYPIEPRNTPLHFAVLQIYSDEHEATELIELLLKNGADVTLRNNDGDTPLHLLVKRFNENLVDCRSARLLLKSIKNSNVDDANSHGMSFFHFACVMRDVEVAKIFLQNGIDVNRPVSYHIDRYSLCSPLHLIAGYRSQRSDDSTLQLQIIDLLLKHGANIHLLDAFGNTPLHKVAKSSGKVDTSREKIFDIFIRNGLDINAENVLGETPLELLMKSGNATWVEVECFLKHGSRINSYNPITQEGYISQLFSDSFIEKQKALTNDVILNLITSEYVTDIDSYGRSFLHNFVSVRDFDIEDYIELIEQLLKHGCHINHQDEEGRTALHIATWFRNNQGVLGLMKNGADVNISDKNGKTAFAYSFESPHKSSSYENRSDPDHVINTFAMHVYKMETCGLYISEDNRRFQVDALEMYYLKEDVLKRFREDIKKAKSIQIESTALTLYDFSFKMDTEMIYPSMPFFERHEIDQFFENIGQHKLYELDYLLKLKYEKARERFQLIKSAVLPFSIIIKNQLPELCCRIILSFLSTADLENVIATENL